MPSIKTIGASGQIALGKQFAGREVLVDQVAPGVWVIKLGTFVPQNEQWLHEPATRESLDRAVRWAEENPPRETDLEELARRIG